MMDEETVIEDLKEEDLKVSSTTDEEEIEDVEEETGEEKAATPAAPAASSLETKLAELEASNKGLVKSLSAQRNIRQDLQGQLNGIKEALATFKNSQTQAANAINNQALPSAIPVDFDAEGNPYLDPRNLSGLANAEIKRLEQRINQMQYQAANLTTQQREKQALNSLLSEKEGYKDAYTTITKAWNFLKDDVFDDYLTARGLEPPKTADAAIEIALKSRTIASKFAEKFPGVDMESVLEAHLIATPRYFRKALDKASITSDSSHMQLDLGKPTSLALANSSGGEGHESLKARVAEMSTEDFMALDAATMAKIDKLLEAHG